MPPPPVALTPEQARRNEKSVRKRSSRSGVSTDNSLRSARPQSTSALCGVSTKPSHDESNLNIPPPPSQDPPPLNVRQDPEKGCGVEQQSNILRINQAEMCSGANDSGTNLYLGSAAGFNRDYTVIPTAEDPQGSFVSASVNIGGQHNAGITEGPLADVHHGQRSSTSRSAPAEIKKGFEFPPHDSTEVSSLETQRFQVPCQLSSEGSPPCESPLQQSPPVNVQNYNNTCKARIESISKKRCSSLKAEALIENLRKQLACLEAEREELRRETQAELSRRRSVGSICGDLGAASSVDPDQFFLLFCRAQELEQEVLTLRARFAERESLVAQRRISGSSSGGSEGDISRNTGARSNFCNTVEENGNVRTSGGAASTNVEGSGRRDSDYCKNNFFSEDGEQKMRFGGHDSVSNAENVCLRGDRSQSDTGLNEFTPGRRCTRDGIPVGGYRFSAADKDESDNRCALLRKQITEVEREMAAEMERYQLEIRELEEKALGEESDKGPNGVVEKTVLDEINNFRAQLRDSELETVVLEKQIEYLRGALEGEKTLLAAAENDFRAITKKKIKLQEGLSTDQDEAVRADKELVEAKILEAKTLYEVEEKKATIDRLRSNIENLKEKTAAAIHINESTPLVIGNENFVDLLDLNKINCCDLKSERDYLHLRLNQLRTSDELLRIRLSALEEEAAKTVESEKFLEKVNNALESENAALSVTASTQEREYKKLADAETQVQEMTFAAEEDRDKLASRLKTLQEDLVALKKRYAELVMNINRQASGEQLRSAVDRLVDAKIKLEDVLSTQQLLKGEIRKAGAEVPPLNIHEEIPLSCKRKI